MAEFVSESESDDDELLPPAKIPKVESSYDDEEAAEFAPTGLDEEEPQSGADDWVIGVVYRRTVKFIVVSHPLFGTHYFGQAVRRVAHYGTDPQKVAAARWGEENSTALRVHKRLGLLAVIRELGADTFEDAVIDFRIGHRRDVQPWADKQEIGNIAAYGGPLQDMHARLPQTLNLSKGGKGDFKLEGRIARNNLAWRDFLLALTEYVEEHGTAYVPLSTVSPSGYRLGSAITRVRQGDVWKGWPDQKKRKECLEAFTGWTWNAIGTDEWKAYSSKKHKDWWTGITPEQRADHTRIRTEAARRPEVRAANSQSHKKWWANLTPDEHTEQVRKIIEFNRRPEARAAASQKAKQQFVNETDEQRVERNRRKNEAQRRPEARTAASEKTKQQFATQEARDAASERTKQQFAKETPDQRNERLRRKNEAQRRPEARTAASEKTKQQFATQEARDAASQRAKQRFETKEARDAMSQKTKQHFVKETPDQRDERLRKQTEAQNRPEVRAAASEKTKQQFATQEARDRVAEDQRKVARAKQEAKLATLSEAEQAKARVIIKRNQDKQAHRKRRLDALRRVAGWEHAAMKDLTKAKAAGIVLQVCKCGVVCECKVEGSSSGSV